MIDNIRGIKKSQDTLLFSLMLSILRLIRLVLIPGILYVIANDPDHCGS